jgi:PAS domain S-box-containing protein
MNIETIPLSAGGPAQAPQPQGRPAAVASASAFHDDPINILIVDDEPRNLTVLETILDDPKYRLVRAESADQALHALISQEFALLILDIRMPGMTGFELAQMIKERKKTSQVPIIFLTAYYNEDQHVLEGYSNGAVDYLHKPVNPAILRSKVAVFAELHWKNRECGIANRALLDEVAERRRAEEELRELNETLEQRVAERTEALAAAGALQNTINERYRSLFDSSLDAIFSLGPDERFETVNPAALRLTGRTLEELKSIRFLDLFAPDQRGALEKAYHDAFHCQSFSMDTIIATSTGECRELSISGAPVVANDEVIGILCIARDITERMRINKALRDSDERMQLAREATGVGIWEWHILDGRIKWDAMMFKIYGIAPTAEGIVQYSTWSGAVLPEDLPDQEAILQNTVRRLGHSSRTFRIRRRDDGECRFIQAVETVRLNDHGQAEWVVGTNLDITERKQDEELLRRREEALACELSERIQVEERLRRLADTLESQVQERTLQLSRSYDRLRALATELTVTEQTERRRLATELHDYLAQLLVVTRMKVGQLLSRDQDETVRVILLDADQLLHQSLDYTRTLVSELTPQALYERGLIAAVQWLGDQLVRQHMLAVEIVSDSPELPLSETEAVLLFHSIRELLFNVLKHAKTDRASVRLSYSQDLLSITVSDPGCGFEVSELRDDRFGLLSIRERMMALGGGFNLQSELGKGTVVSLYMPCTRSGKLVEEEAAGVELRPPLAPAAIPRAHGLVSTVPTHGEADAVTPVRVMIVDDHEMVREGLRCILSQYAGLAVVGEASTGEEAVQLADLLQPDVVLMDMHMPGWNGAESTRRIMKARPSTVVIGLSVHTDPSIAQSMLDAGAVAFMSKDTIGTELYSLIQTSIQPVVKREASLDRL